MAEEEQKAEKKEETEETGGGLDDDDDGELLLKSSDGKDYKVNKKYAKMSAFVTTLLKGDPNATEIDVRQVEGQTLERIVQYLNEHKGVEPPPLPCPVRSTNMEQIVSHKWDATFIDAFDKKAIFEIILGANYMDIKPLLHLGCAKIATEIKKLDQKEINRIIEEQEKWEREHGASAGASAEKEENKEAGK